MSTLKIKSIEVESIHVNHRGNWVFILVHSEEGSIGIGEASHSRKDEQIHQIIKNLEPNLIGFNIFDFESYRRRFFTDSEGHTYHTIISAIEHAMWDLAGKKLDVPSHQLLGGRCRSKIRLYANINRATIDRSPLGFAKNAEKAVEEGFTAIKCAPFDGVSTSDISKNSLNAAIRQGIERLRMIRDTIGEDIDLMVDCHSRFNAGLIVQTSKELDDLNLFWIEDPIPLDDLDAVAHVSQSTSMPIATGEKLRTLEEFNILLRLGRVDYILPDIKHVGGLLGLKKIATLAETTNVKITPHNPSGPVATAASVQCMATIPNFGILEYAWGEVDWRSTLVDPPETITNGFIDVPDIPGLGISLNL
ncbi:mandelate racemase/muconate lactonizing enzyme family protein [Candidatus Poribacteria bacterium]|nr:mandelate racemase/muconate lactonizing enzyme family protein [Candidatus Poribacteria bacterium]